MPLPPALAARLAKRGIIPKAQEKRDEQEEVFAESYDDGEDGGSKLGGRSSTAAEKAEDKLKFLGYPGCPNKWNVYHECQIFCLNKWGTGKTDPDPDYMRKHQTVLNKYGPLPDGWKEQYDPGTGRHYYWCTRTDRVSWLPPGHPKARITEAASSVREMLQSQVGVLEDDDDQAMDLDSDMDSENEDEDREIEERRRREKDKRREEQDRYRSRDRDRGRSRGGGDRVDPMDPSAYSDVPRGTWSSGLETKDDK